MTEKQEAVAIVMAAGKSTRMKSDRPKVLHELCYQPVLAYVLDALEEAGIHRKLIVVGFQADQVRTTFSERPGVEFVLQDQQLGTGHAVGICSERLKGHTGSVIVIAGDQPLVRGQLVVDMLARLRETGAKALLATAIVDDPTGLGRIVRDREGRFAGIVEQKDATAEQAAIREINPSFYAFDGPLLFHALEQVKPNNAQKEYYLTDVPAILRSWGELIIAESLATQTDVHGINHRTHLAQAHLLLQARVHQRHMDAGVTIIDPRSTVIDPRARIGQDTVIHPFTVIEGPVRIGTKCVIGPFAHVKQDVADGKSFLCTETRGGEGVRG